EDVKAKSVHDDVGDGPMKMQAPSEHVIGTGYSGNLEGERAVAPTNGDLCSQVRF
ncbi:hypothetical protein PIB30_111933, partial [Stylosanthes scabra]|nr:hypothetical protein [Stylosanthes scabra]